MPLFREHPLRSVLAATAALSIGHFATKLLASPHATQVTQTSVAIIAIAALVFLIIIHHRQDGQLLTQSQEEAVIIGGLALLWIAVIVAWRSSSGAEGASTTKGLDIAKASPSQPGWRSWTENPCPEGDAYCHIIEEYSFF